MTVQCPPLTVYSFENVEMTIDNREVVGFWEGDDVVSIARETDVGTVTRGADGANAVSVTADQSATLTLRLQPNSAMNQYLEQRVKLLRMGSQRYLQVAVRDSTSGEGGGCTAAIIIREPSVAFGTSISVREWVIFCNCWQPNDIQYAPVAA